MIGHHVISLHGWRVLLAEDNPTNQMATIRMLEKLGCQVDLAVNGVEAVEAFRTVEYRIILMDNQMPEMDGVTATHAIRLLEEAEGRPRVPIVALTADAMCGDKEECLAAGMDDFLSKPFKVAELHEVMGRWGGSSASTRRLHVAEPAPNNGALDLAVLDDLRGADDGANRFVTRLIEHYLSESASLLSQLTDAARRSDAPALRFAAHSLKGTSVTVGARGLAAVCASLEHLAHAPTFDGSSELVTQLEAEFTRVHRALHAVQDGDLMTRALSL